MPADVTIQSNPLPLSLFEGDLQDTLDLFADHLQGTLSNTVITGQVGGTEPVSNIGPWFAPNGLWYQWNSTESKYLPAPIAIGRIFTGTTVILTKFVATNTADRMIYTPDKDGTMALTRDVYGERDTATLTGATPTTNWIDEYKNYYIVMSANTTLSISNASDGQERNIWVEQPTGAAWTFAISNCLFNNGTYDPTATDLWTTPDPLNRKVSHFKVRIVGNNTFAEQVDGYLIPDSGAGSDLTAPSVDSIERTSSGTITINYDELLQSLANVTTDFAVVYSPGGSKMVSSAITNGNKVTLVIAGGTNNSGTGVTVAYSGSTVKDLAGNTAGTYAATAATYTSNLVGGSGGGGGGGGGGQNVP